MDDVIRFPGLLPMYLHAASGQKPEVQKVWKWGYGLNTYLFYAIIPTSFPCFLPFSYLWISLHCNIFLAGCIPESDATVLLVTVVPVDKTYVVELNQSFVQQSE